MSYHFCPECGGDCFQCEGVLNGLDFYDGDTCSHDSGAESNSKSDDSDIVSSEES